METRSLSTENTEPTRKGEHGGGVDESAERTGRVHDDEGTQFGGGARRSGS
jgi:hypothetical protein